MEVQDRLSRLYPRHRPEPRTAELRIRPQLLALRQRLLAIRLSAVLTAFSFVTKSAPGPGASLRLSIGGPGLQCPIAEAGGLRWQRSEERRVGEAGGTCGA